MVLGCKLLAEKHNYKPTCLFLSSPIRLICIFFLPIVDIQVARSGFKLNAAKVIQKPSGDLN